MKSVLVTGSAKRIGRRLALDMAKDGWDVAVHCHASLAEAEEVAQLNRALQEEGRLILAGPHPAIDSPVPGEAGFTGSLVVAEFPDLETARAWADADPYVAAGVYQEVQVKPFNLVFPA